MLDVCGAEFCWLELKLPLTCDTFRVCDVNTDAATDWLSGDGAVGCGGAGDELNTPATEQTVNMSEYSNMKQSIILTKWHLAHKLIQRHVANKIFQTKTSSQLWLTTHVTVQFNLDHILKYYREPICTPKCLPDVSPNIAFEKKKVFPEDSSIIGCSVTKF